MKNPIGVLKKRDSHIFDRQAGEWYCEPIAVSTALFAAEEFEGAIWDPACGSGNILEAAFATGRSRFGHILGTDIIKRNGIRVGLFHGVYDFFQWYRPLLAPNIVTNPPFGRAILAEKFIRHAISLKPKKLAVFVDSRFLFGKARAAGLFAEFPPSRVWLITPRPSCPPGEYLAAGNKAGGGTADYVWLVFTPQSPPSSTELRWLRCAS